MKFSDDLWLHNGSIYQEILMHPFNIELIKGTENRFRFYLQQDACYLRDFSRVLALIAERSNSPKMSKWFLYFSSSVLIAECELRSHFLSPDFSYDTTELSAACLSYTRYLIATVAVASLEEAIAAVLPCFWIYREVGRCIRNQVREDNPYALWLKTYSNQEFSDDTDQIIAILNEVASQCQSHLLVLMKKTFEYSSLFEWHFLDDAYNMTTFQTAYTKNNVIR